MDALRVKQNLIADEIKRVSNLNIAPSDKLNSYLESMGTAPMTTGCKLADLIRRPQLNYNYLAIFDSGRPDLSDDVCEQVNLQIKYEGYISKQLMQIEQMRKLESLELPYNTDYSQIHGLRLEAAEKLNKVQPVSIGQASRISGVSPADVSLLAVWIHQRKG